MSLLIPEYEDFYKELLADKASSFEDKLAALVNFIESEVIDSQLDIDVGRIAEVSAG